MFVELACWDVHFTYILRVYTFATTDHANPWRTDLDPTQAHSRWAERCTDASSSLGCTHMSRSGAGQGHESQRCSTRSFNSSGSSAARRRRVGGAGQDLRCGLKYYLLEVVLRDPALPSTYKHPRHGASRCENRVVVRQQNLTPRPAAPRHLPPPPGGELE